MRPHYFLDPLPQSIHANGQDIRINSDFRAVLCFYRLTGEDPEEHLIEALTALFDDDIPEITEELTEALEVFVNGGAAEKKKGLAKSLLGLNNNKPFDFMADDRLIWSAFFYAYKINLRSIPYLHWWDFLQLMEELPDSVRLEKVIHYRTIDTNGPGVGKEQKKVYDALQRHYKLTEQKKSPEDELIAEALRQGKDPAQFLK